MRNDAGEMPQRHAQLAVIQEIADQLQYEVRRWNDRHRANELSGQLVSALNVHAEEERLADLIRRNGLTDWTQRAIREHLADVAGNDRAA